MKYFSFIAAVGAALSLSSCMTSVSSGSQAYVDDIYGGSAPRKTVSANAATYDNNQNQTYTNSYASNTVQQQPVATEQTIDIDMEEYSPGMFESMLSEESTVSSTSGQSTQGSYAQKETSKKDDNVNVTINFGWTPSWYAGAWAGWGYYSPSWTVYNSWYNPWYYDPWFYPTYYPPYYPPYYRPYYGYYYRPYWHHPYWGHHHYNPYWGSYSRPGGYYYNSNRHHSGYRAYNSGTTYSNNRRSGTMMGSSSGTRDYAYGRGGTSTTKAPSESGYFNRDGSTKSNGTTYGGRAGGSSTISRGGSTGSSSSTINRGGSTGSSSGYTPNSGGVRSAGTRTSPSSGTRTSPSSGTSTRSSSPSNYNRSGTSNSYNRSGGTSSYSRSGGSSYSGGSRGGGGGGYSGGGGSRSGGRR